MAEEATGSSCELEALVVGEQYEVRDEDGAVLFTAVLAGRQRDDGVTSQLTWSNGGVLLPDLARFTFTAVDGRTL